MELFLLYLWLKLDSVLSLLLVIVISSGFAYLFGWLPRSWENFDNKADNGSEFHKKYCRWHNRLVFIALGALCIGTVLPSSKDTAILVGASIALDVAKSPEGQKIGTLIRGKANELLDNEIKKLNQPATK